MISLRIDWRQPLELKLLTCCLSSLGLGATYSVGAYRASVLSVHGVRPGSLAYSVLGVGRVSARLPVVASGCSPTGRRSQVSRSFGCWRLAATRE